MSKMKFNSGRVISSREDSLTSEVDDLTVIAEFDYPSDEEDVPSYQITSPYEVVGWSLADSSKLLKDGPVVSESWVREGSDRFSSDGDRNFNRTRVDDDTESFPDGKSGNRLVEKMGRRSMATSPIWSSDLKRKVSQDENIYYVTSYSPVVDCNRYDTVHWSEPASGWKQSQVLSKSTTSDKFTTTDPIEGWHEADHESLRAEPTIPVRDENTMTEKLVTRSVSTGTDHHEELPASPVALATASSQTFIQRGNASVQVSFENAEEKQMADLEKSLEEMTRWRNLAEDVRMENEDLKRASENLKIEVVKLREYPENLKMLEKEKTDLEKALSEVEDRMKIILKDSEDDAKGATLRLDKASTDLAEKDVQIRELSSQLDDYKTRQESLERVIHDLKLHLRNANIQLPGTFERTENNVDQSNIQNKNIDVDMKSSLSADKESEDFLRKINSDVKNASLTSAFMGEGSDDLLRKYNNLRRIAGNLQTSVSPLKAKLALANKKSRLKDDLLNRLIKETDVPLYLKKEVEENLTDKDHYRALSPLTLTRINRLEHDLFNHLYEKIPYFGHVDETQPQQILSSSDDFVYERTAKSEEPLEKKSHSSVFVPPADDLFPDIRVSRRSGTAPSTSFERVHEIPSRDENSRLSKDFIPRENFSIGNYDKSSRRIPFSRLNPHIKSTPPPQQFRIEDILGMKKFLFCWEAPKTGFQSIVGYELKVNGVKRDFIPGAFASKYSLDFPPDQKFPVVFELFSIRSDGHQSVPSTIVVHGLQKISSVIGRDSTGGPKLGYKLSEPTEKPIAEKRNMYYAFYDYVPTGFTFTKDGVTYSELSFKTGNLIETYGEPMPNGYILGKIAGTTHLGLIPLTFLERIHGR